MSEYGWLAFYSVSILIFSCAGGSVPFLGKVTHDRLQMYLSFSAGVMLGASFFHVMPEAMNLSKEYFGWWMSLGVVSLFCIERFIAPHSHEMNGGHHHHGHDHHHHHDGHEETGQALAGKHGQLELHEHIASSAPSAVPDRRAAAPAVAGWTAVLGLTLHTFMNGVGLAGAVQAVFDALAKNGGSGTVALTAFPGLALWLAILLHKPADALAISTVLSRKGIGRQLITLVQIGFALMVPVGAAAFLVTRGEIEASMRHQLTGAALAFSAGTFLFIALSDLLPEVQFHRHDRVPLFLCLLGGVIFMGAIALLEGHDEGEHAHDDHAAEHQESDGHARH